MTKLHETFRVIFAIVVAFVTLVAPAVTAEAGTEPYCYIYEDDGYTVVEYNYYVSDIARADRTKVIKVDNDHNKIFVGSTLVTKSHKNGSKVSWSADGKFVIWKKTNNVLYAYNPSNWTNKQLAKNVSTVNLNGDLFAETVTYQNGNTSKVTELLSGISTQTPSSNQSSSSGNSTSSSSSTPASSSSTKELRETTNSDGHHIYSFGSYKLDVFQETVKFTKGSKTYTISEQCNSAVRYVGIAKIGNEFNIFLYEDKSNSYYRFTTDDIFNPTKIKFADGGTLQNVIRDNNGWLTKVVTTKATYDVSSLRGEDDDDVDYVSYAINKKSYSTLYRSDGVKYVISRNDAGNLVMQNNFVTSGIAEKSKQFGFDASNFYFIKSGTEYKAPISNPKNYTLVRTGVTKLTYSSSNGFVTGAK